MTQSVSVKSIEEAHSKLKDVVKKTDLERSEYLSERFAAEVYIKREDSQVVRSYKVRGAYNKISSLSQKELDIGVVCASAGNHAQGVALSCRLLKTKGIIYMPTNTPRQKVDRVVTLGQDWVTTKLVGNTFDEACAVAKKASITGKQAFIHPFDDPLIISGQGTVGLEVVDQLDDPADMVIAPIGGGGLIAGLATYFKDKSPSTEIIGVQPAGAPSMHRSLLEGKPVVLENIDKFVDGAAVFTPGDHTFAITKQLVRKIEIVPEGKVCQEMISLYQTEGIIVEPAGALSVAVLDQIADKIRGKRVVCIISGGNNDVGRYAEILERSLIYQGLKHYFIIEFPQRPGALRAFLDSVLIDQEDVTVFEYIKKNNREYGPALVGIELPKKENLPSFLTRMKETGFAYLKVEEDSTLFRFLL